MHYFAAVIVLLACASGCKSKGKNKPKDEPAVAAKSASGDPALPGIESPSAAFEAELRAEMARKGSSYPVRTQHRKGDGSPTFVNRLIRETSPYLLQHAHNPVNWYSWGDEPFERARRENKPVLLSIGYSTCHWCHVMERESFEDAEVAELLNRYFVCIKVDREERPDVDELYMTAIQVIAGRGGWPMTVFTTGDRKPFTGGTYFAKDNFVELLETVREAYANDKGGIDAESAAILREVTAASTPLRAPEVPSIESIDSAVTSTAHLYDSRNGGFGRPPKFPQPARLELLLRHYRRTGKDEILAMVSHTLERMAQGGIHDHIAGGFHRYSTDTNWLVPHFEKMLYDNAQLAALYVQAFKATGRRDFSDVARRTLDYVLGEMTDPAGGFYSATDADSETPDGSEQEGYFYTWTHGELEDILGPELSRPVVAWFAVTPEGNYEGRSILHAPRPLAQVAAELDITEDELAAAIDEARAKLYRARRKRPAPLRDDKILTAWNGLMISALSRAAGPLGEPRYAASARRAASFVLKSMRIEGGRLARSWRLGQARHAAVLDDYAFLIQGLLDLFEATSEPHWLDSAAALQRDMNEQFLDAAGGGYFTTASSSEKLLVQSKPTLDGALPAGNSVALLNLVRLYELTGEESYRKTAEAGFTAFGGAISLGGIDRPKMLSALDYYLDQPLQIILVHPADGPVNKELARAVHRSHVPNHTLVEAVEGPPLAAIAERVPTARDKHARAGASTAYVCQRGTCKLPTSDPDILARQLARIAQAPED